MALDPVVVCNEISRAVTTRAEVVVTNLYAAEFPWCLEPLFLQSMSLRGSGPNLLINCSGGEVHKVAREVKSWCDSPVRTCSMPGRLDLPSDFSGTLILTHIEEMSLEQQMALFDWLTVVHSRVRVVSIATTRIDSFVRDGRFLEGLFYRLNVVQFEARSPRVSEYHALQPPIPEWHAYAPR
jgi:transcriptional regulator of acetoin/glycerol metabolism